MLIVKGFGSWVLILSHRSGRSDVEEEEGEEEGKRNPWELEGIQQRSEAMKEHDETGEGNSNRLWGKELLH